MRTRVRMGVSIRVLRSKIVGSGLRWKDESADVTRLESALCDYRIIYTHDQHTKKMEKKSCLLTLNTTTGFSLHVSPTIRLTSPRARALTSKFNTSYDPPNSLTRAAIQARFCDGLDGLRREVCGPYEEDRPLGTLRTGRQGSYPSLYCLRRKRVCK